MFPEPQFGSSASFAKSQKPDGDERKAKKQKSAKIPAKCSVRSILPPLPVLCLDGFVNGNLYRGVGS